MAAGLRGVECLVTGVMDVGGMRSGMGVMGAAGVEAGGLIGLMVAIEGGKVGWVGETMVFGAKKDGFAIIGYCVSSNIMCLTVYSFPELVIHL